jgi:hypothetical protein
MLAYSLVQWSEEVPGHRIGPTLEHIETDTAKLVNIGVVDFGQESNLWWTHRVVIWQEKLKFEDAAYSKSESTVS